MRTLVIVAAVAVSTMTAFAGGKPAGIIVPPVAAEVGASSPLGVATPETNSTELRVGVHSASLYWKPTRFDVGIGFAGSFRSLPSGMLERTVDGPLAEQSLSLRGVYVSFAYAIENHRNWRTWLGGRVDTMTGEYQGRSLNVVGGAVRLSAEIYHAGAHAAGDRNVLALMAGAWALGVYVEGTARTLPDELGPVGVGAGVSMRVPFILAVAD